MSIVKTISRPQRRWRRSLEVLVLLLILALAAYLRLAHNLDNPGWYADEGTHVLIGQSLAAGRVQYMAINRSTLLFAKLPLFDLLLAAVFRLGGQGMDALRTLTGLLGVMSVATLYGCLRLIKREPWLALLAALLLAVYPQAVLYSRLGFSYNLLAPLVLLAFLGLWNYVDVRPDQPCKRRRWLALAALAIGTGITSDLWMLALLPPLALVVAARDWRDLLWSLPLALLPFGLYTAVMLGQWPQAFLFDLNFTLSRLSRLSLAQQIRSLALNYTILVSQSHWMALSLVGLFLLRPIRLQSLALLFLLFPICMIGRTEALVNLSAHYMIPLLPFVSLGVAVLLRRGLPYAGEMIHQALSSIAANWRWLPLFGERSRVMDVGLRGSAYLLATAVVLSPFVTAGMLLMGQVNNSFNTDIEPFLVEPQDARKAAAYVNAHAEAGDVVIASPSLAWLLQAQTADLQMSMAASGQATPHLPADIPASRFAFDADYRNARYVVVDNFWPNWAVHNVPGAGQMLETVAEWPFVFRAGAIEVYCNPGPDDCPSG
jgi:4-amino-4-deoxy-L-arabinose transferase-like glycosyltransferase